MANEEALFINGQCVKFTLHGLARHHLPMRDCVTVFRHPSIVSKLHFARQCRPKVFTILKRDQVKK